MAQTVQSADGTTIAYERTGSGSPLVIVGGALNTRMSPAGLVPLLAEHFTVVTYDRRGRGESTDTPPYAVEREVEDLAAVVSAIGAPVHLYGHSSGAILCLEAAAAGVKVSRLAVYEPPYLTGGKGEGNWQVFVDKVQALVDEGRRDQAVQAFLRNTGADVDDSVLAEPWWPALTEVAHTLPYDLTLVGDGEVSVDRLSRISAPVLALYGGASAPWAEESAAAVCLAVQDGRQQKIADASHGVAPDAVGPVLLDFFA